MNVILITGASVGIGEAFARQLASEKHNLLLVARSENKLSALCDELSAKYHINAQYIAVDLIKADADQIIFEETEKRGLQVAWLINNAGIGSGGDLLEHDLKSQVLGSIAEVLVHDTNAKMPDLDGKGAAVFNKRNIYENESNFSPGFWFKYNTLLPTAEEMKALQ